MIMMRNKKGKHIAICLLSFVLLLSVSSCRKQAEAEQPKQADLAAVMQEIGKVEPLENFIDIDDGMLMEMYGIEAADCKQFAAKIEGSGIKADEITLIEAADTAKAADIRSKLEARLQAKANEADDYSEEQYAIIKKANVEVNGNYVSMIVSPRRDGILEVYHSQISEKK